MAVTLTSLSDLTRLGFDMIIDVRAPSEFAEDHVPGAVSLPVLNDAERARVGTIYKQVSPFTARKLGAALVSRNAATHLEGPLADKPGGWQPLVYCWRGGQRSGAFATILAQIGWRAETLAGGYKSFRGLVVKQVYDMPVVPKVVVLDGNTGTAKTDILNRLPGLGVQVLDLEGLARHRGSLFGHMPDGQPSQKAFETAIAMVLVQADPSRPLVVEAESAKVGDLRVPPQLWAAMCKAPRVIVEAGLDERARYLTRAYADIVADEVRLADVIGLLRHAHAKEVIDSWSALAQSRQFTALAHDLMQAHYDPRYEKHRGRMEVASVTVKAVSLEDLALDGLAVEVAAAVALLAGQVR